MSLINNYEVNIMGKICNYTRAIPPLKEDLIGEAFLITKENYPVLFEIEDRLDEVLRELFLKKEISSMADLGLSGEPVSKDAPDLIREYRGLMEKRTRIYRNDINPKIPRKIVISDLKNLKNELTAESFSYYEVEAIITHYFLSGYRGSVTSAEAFYGIEQEINELKDKEVPYITTGRVGDLRVEREVEFYKLISNVKQGDIIKIVPGTDFTALGGSIYLHKK